MQSITEENGCDVNTVLNTLQGVLNPDNNIRYQSEKLLREWERDAKPGFLQSLMNIMNSPQQFDETVRLMCAVVSKNAVGQSWRKVLGSREWLKVPEEEKQFVRSKVMEVLFNDPSDKVALQVAVLIANIARFDFPMECRSLLKLLYLPLVWDNDNVDQNKASRSLRGFKAVKYTLKALRERPLTVHLSHKPMGAGEFLRQSQLTLEYKEYLHGEVSQCLCFLMDQWYQHMQSITSMAHDAQARIQSCRGCLVCIREGLRSVDKWNRVAPFGKNFLGQMYTYSQQFQHMVQDENVIKCFYLMVQCAQVAMTRWTAQFARHIPNYLQLYVQHAILNPTREQVHALVAKYRLSITRFIASVIVSPFYRNSQLQLYNVVSTDVYGDQERQERYQGMQAAQQAVDSLLSPKEPHFSLLLNSIISKYIALSGEGIQDWVQDPEGFMEVQQDGEVGPDAEHPHQCGLWMLQCILDKSGSMAVEELMNMVLQLKKQQQSEEVLLLLDACYHAIGQLFQFMKSCIVFNDWYSAELRSVISQPSSGPNEPIQNRIVRARACWLVGKCGAELSSEKWQDALGCLMIHTRDSDLVVCLTALQAVNNLLNVALEMANMLECLEPKVNVNALVSQLDAMAINDAANQAAENGQEVNPDEISALKDKLNVRRQKFQEVSVNLLQVVFVIMEKLAEDESRAMLINLVSGLVDLLGPTIGKDQLQMTSEAIQSLWALNKQGSKASGSMVCLHGSLMSLMSQLLRKIRGNQGISIELQKTMFALLNHALNPNNKEYEYLLEESLSLWLSGMCMCVDFSSLFGVMLPTLINLLQRGKELVLGYMVMEAYLFLSPLSDLLQHIPNVLECVKATLMRIYIGLSGMDDSNEMEDELNSIKDKSQPLDDELCQEGLQACVLIDVLGCKISELESASCNGIMEQLQRVHSIMVDVFLLPHVQLLSSSKHIGLLEGMAETLGQILARNPSYLITITGGDQGKQASAVNTWIMIAASRYMSEMIGLPMALLLARYKRRMATVVLCNLICSYQYDWIANDENRLEKIMSLFGISLIEDEAFKQDQQEIDTNISQDSNLQHDKVTMKRLELLRSRDAIRASNIVVVIQGFFQRLDGLLISRQAMVRIISSVGHPDIVEALMGLLGDEKQENGQNVDF